MSLKPQERTVGIKVAARSSSQSEISAWRKI